VTPQARWLDPLRALSSISATFPPPPLHSSRTRKRIAFLPPLFVALWSLDFCRRLVFPSSPPLSDSVFSLERKTFLLLSSRFPLFRFSLFPVRTIASLFGWGRSFLFLTKPPGSSFLFRNNVRSPAPSSHSTFSLKDLDLHFFNALETRPRFSPGSITSLVEVLHCLPFLLNSPLLGCGPFLKCILSFPLIETTLTSPQPVRLFLLPTFPPFPPNVSFGTLFSRFRRLFFQLTSRVQKNSSPGRPFFNPSLIF